MTPLTAITVGTPKSPAPGAAGPVKVAPPFDEMGGYTLADIRRSVDHLNVSDGTLLAEEVAVGEEGSGVRRSARANWKSGRFDADDWRDWRSKRELAGDSTLRRSNADWVDEEGKRRGAGS